MKLSILVPCLTSRNYKPLLEELQQQAAKFVGDVEVLQFVDDGTLTSGQKRNALTAEAQGDYIAFVDDDDFVSTCYVESLVEATSHDTDIISFNMVRITPKNSEVWVLNGDTDAPKTGRMSSNHLCAWKKSVATKVAWCNALGYGDDQLWYRPLLHVCTPSRYHIDKMLYTYLCGFIPADKSNHTNERIKAAKSYFGEGLRVFSDSGEIFIEEPDVKEAFSASHVFVRDRHNNIYRRHLGSLIPEFTCKVN